MKKKIITLLTITAILMPMLQTFLSYAEEATQGTQIVDGDVKHSLSYASIEGNDELYEYNKNFFTNAINSDNILGISENEDENKDPHDNAALQSSDGNYDESISSYIEREGTDINIHLSKENNYEAYITGVEEQDGEFTLAASNTYTLHVWITDETIVGGLGRNIPSTVRLGNKTYLCYEILAGNGSFKYDGTDTLYTTSSSYTATETIYDPSGKVVHSYSYNNNNNWISVTWGSSSPTGKYSGNVTLSGGLSLSCDVSWYVYDTIPIFISDAKGQVVTAGDPATISVSASGTHLSYQWYCIETNGKNYAISGATSPSYTIDAVTPFMNERSYYCVASNYGNNSIRSFSVSAVGQYTGLSNSLPYTTSTYIGTSGRYRYFSFTPNTTASYIFESTLSSGDSYGYLYNSSGTELATDDDSGVGANFKIEYTLTAGNTYFFAVKYWNSSSTGTIPVKLSRSEPDCTIIYNYRYNGGTSVTKSSAAVAKGTTVDLTPTATKSGWTFIGWNTNPNATTALSSYTVTSDTTLYAIYSKTITARLYSANNTLQTKLSATIYNRETRGNITLPSPAYYSGWTTEGWRADTNAAQPTYSRNSIVAITEDTMYYAIYSRAISLSYNANGGISTPSTQTSTQYYNSYGNKESKIFTLASAISRNGYSFDKWAMGNPNGISYTSGSKVSVSDNTVMYATWIKANPTTTPTATPNKINLELFEVEAQAVSDSVKLKGGISAKICNNTDQPIEGKIITAYKNGDGNLIAANISDLKISSNKTINFIDSINITNVDSVEYADIFIWDSFEKMNPLVNKTTTSVTNQTIDISRRPNAEPIDIGKLYQLTSDDYIESLLHDDATLRAIDGEFTTIHVNNKEDALLVFDQVAPVLGIGSDFGNFVADDIAYSSAGEGDSQRNFYRLNPTVGEIPVLGSDIVLVVDSNGIPTGLHSSYDSRINFVNPKPTITSSDAENVAVESFRSKIFDMLTSANASNLSTSKIKNYSDFIVDSMVVNSNLIIYSSEQNLPTLTWCINIHTPVLVNSEDDGSSLLEAADLNDSSMILPNFDYSYYVCADNIYAGQILQEVSNIQNTLLHSTDSAKDANNNSRTFNIEVDDKTSRLSDSKRNIKTYQTLYHTTGGFLGFGDTTTPVLPGRIITKGLFGWNKKGVSAHYNMAKAYDFYNQLGRKSYDGNGGEIVVSIEYNPYSGIWDVGWLIHNFFNENACWSPGDEQFMFYNAGNNEVALDVVGHEYTHAVTNTIVGGPALSTTLTYYGETGALNESYSDIMGSLIEGKNRSDINRWLHGEDTGEAHRSFSDPESMGQADNYSDITDQWWQNKLDDYDNRDYEGVHIFSGIFNLAYYKMVMDDDTSCSNTEHNHSSRTSSISDDVWARVFYNSIYHLQIDAKFIDARMAIINEARANGFNETQIRAIKEAFDDVGVTGNDTYLAKDTFDWTWYEHQDYEFKYISPKPANREHSIEINGKDIKMNGFNEESYKDFLFMPNTDDNMKLFSFDLMRDRTDWHSIEGGGFLFNTKIENNTIEGYCILTTQSGLKLVRIDKCDLTSFMDGSYNMVENAGSLLTTVNIGDPYAKQTYVIAVSPTEISVWCNGEWTIDGYKLPTTSESYGFGPITSHESHACNQLSYYTFSNIRMESLR